MKYTASFLEGAAKCTTVEELIAYAGKNDIRLETDEAKNLLEDLTRDYSALSDEEMTNVLGGESILSTTWGPHPI